MRDEASAVEAGGDKAAQRRHIVQHGMIGFERLLDGRSDDTLLALGLYRAALAMLAQKRIYLRHAHLGRLFQKPLETVDVLCRSHGHSEPVGHLLKFTDAIHDLDRTAAGVGLDHAAGIHAAPAVGQMKLVSGLHAQHADAVARLLLGQNMVRRNNIRGIK